MDKPKELITLNNGRVIFIKRLEQWYTYEGLLVGSPSKEFNDYKIESLYARWISIPGHQPNWGQALKHNKKHTYIITPSRTPARQAMMTYDLKTGGISKNISEDTPYELLRDVTCMARFRSEEKWPEDGSIGEYDYSILTIAWFQDNFAFPIAEDILEKIKEIDWNSNAFFTRE